VWMWHLGTWFSRHGGVGVTVGLGDLGGLFQPDGSVILLLFHSWKKDSGLAEMSVFTSVFLKNERASAALHVGN